MIIIIIIIVIVINIIIIIIINVISLINDREKQWKPSFRLTRVATRNVMDDFEELLFLSLHFSF